MSKNPPIVGQQSIKDFVINIRERAKPEVNLGEINRERAIHSTTPDNKTDSRLKAKQRTPPSIEKPKQKKRDMQGEGGQGPTPPLVDPEHQTPVPVEPDDKSDVMINERRILEKIKLLLTPITRDISTMRNDLTELKTDIQDLQEKNNMLEFRMRNIETDNHHLRRRLQRIEDKSLENNILLRGIPDSDWESEEVCKERIAQALAPLVNRERYTDQIDIARNIPITKPRRIGKYNPLWRRAISVTFDDDDDIGYLFANKRRLPQGVFADREYGEETDKARRKLRPIFNTARKLDKYKGKCKLDADRLIIHGTTYTIEDLHLLPDDISGFKSTSRSGNGVLAFFGELNPLSNFHSCVFEHSGEMFHSSEQLIQYMKAIFFDDNGTADRILRSSTALECKSLSKNIPNYDRDRWMGSAKTLCESGIYQKFKQNPAMAAALLDTGNQKLVEASYDKDWGTGIPLSDRNCIHEDHWNSRGLLGIILEEVRNKLSNIGRQDTTMDTTQEEEPVAIGT